MATHRKIIGTTGDVNPEYGSGVVYKDEYGIHWEFWDEPEEIDGKEVYRVYRGDVPDDVFKEYDWLGGAGGGPAGGVAASIGMEPEDLEALGRSKKIADRVEAMEAIFGGYESPENFDSYPIEITRAELNKRWGRVFSRQRAWKENPGRKSTRKSGGSIYTDTPIIPVVVAESVVEEVSGYLSRHGHEADAGLIYEAKQKLADELADRAEAVYKHDEQFRKKIRGSGNKGRDYLYAFTRHWLASDLKKQYPAIYHKLPRDFDMGTSLRENRGSGPKRSGRKSNPAPSLGVAIVSSRPVVGGKRYTVRVDRAEIELTIFKDGSYEVYGKHRPQAESAALRAVYAALPRSRINPRFA